MFLLAPDKYSGERNMLFLWTVLGILFSAGPIPAGQIESSACYALPSCSTMSLSCLNGKIFLLKMQYGKKPLNDPCQRGPGRCNCCIPAETDCFSNYTPYQFGLVYTDQHCWNFPNCNFQAQQPSSFCAGYSTQTFNVADYSCLEDDQITDFYENTSVTASAVAIHYNPTDSDRYDVAMVDNKTWHCQVVTADCDPRQTDVILVKENQSPINASSCSSVGWSGGPFLPCVVEFRYESFTTSTPFHVSVNVGKDRRNPHGWAVVRAQDGSDLRVTCGYNDPTMSRPSPGMTTQSTTTVTATTMTTTKITTTSTPTTRTTAQTTSPQWSSYSTSWSASSSPGSVTLTSSSSTPASQDMTSSSSAGQTGQSVNATPAAADGNTGAIVGGVVAAVVVLVAAVLGVFCYARRPGQKPRADTKPPDTRKSSMHVPLTSVTSGSPSSSRVSEFGTPSHLDGDDGDYDRIGQGPKPQNGHPTAPIIHGNPRSPVEDPDYDRLGGKKPQSSSSNPAATYGRLWEVGGGGEDTDYSYDHLARGRQASSDVVDSDYDTSLRHVTSEGNYDVAGIPRKQHVITGSDYDIAEIVTSEGDYNKVDFQGKKRHVITGSDYDTAEIVTSEGDYNRVDFQRRKKQVINGSDYDLADMVTSDNA